MLGGSDRKVDENKGRTASLSNGSMVLLSIYCWPETPISTVHQPSTQFWAKVWFANSLQHVFINIVVPLAVWWLKKASLCKFLHAFTLASLQWKRFDAAACGQSSYCAAPKQVQIFQQKNDHGHMCYFCAERQPRWFSLKWMDGCVLQSMCHSCYPVIWKVYKFIITTRFLSRRGEARWHRTSRATITWDRKKMSD